ncbi:uncharacterized protein Dwil_GK14489 [Drosophila willistoni]|uniref:Uncharacterized protein n=1 Tax=Drosophila willistoni TaxID=7260 RepID=B4NK81_DROWI|nr:uncharacterized protein LOC6651744 [Drosophila willistoni]EDW85123.1 uncharacterized protein Dwil_GK14489 [Drosophila willistoni]
MSNHEYIKKALLVLALIYSSLAPAECAYEKEIQAFLEELRLRMCHPIPNLGLPQLDPLELGPASTSQDNKYLVDFTGSIEGFQLHGLSDFDLPEDALKIQTDYVRRSSINVTLPHTYFQSLYTAKGSLAYILNLSGDGNAETSLKDFSVLITFRLKAGVYLGITGLTIDFRLGGIHIDFPNLIEEQRVNDFFHDLINQIGVELLGDVWSYEQDTVIDKIQTIVNNFLGNYTLLDIIKIITGSGGEGTPIFDGVEPNCKD